MIYILHHPNGTLMLAAQDKNQVLEWSKQQLGKKARLVSISEKDVSEAVGFVEKEGTGITAREAERCQPLNIIMANCAHQESATQGSKSECNGNVGYAPLNGMKPTVH
jgi:hypothetical protein